MSTKDLQHCLGNIRKLKSEIEKFFPVDKLDIQYIKQSVNKDHLCKIISSLASSMDDAFRLLSETGGRETVSLKSITDNDYRFFRDFIEPNRDHTKDLGEYCSNYEIVDFIEQLFSDIAEKDLVSRLPDKTTTPPVLNTIQKSIEYYEDRADDNDHIEFELEFSSANTVVDSSYFKPDEWLLNIKALRPLLLSKHAEVPERLTWRLKALYQSYLFGNWLGVLALGRAVLEFALRDKAGSDLAGQKLGGLIDNIPLANEDIRDNMRRIQERGNMIMHPIRNREISDIPTQKSLAQKTFSDLIIILEELYRK